MAPVSEQSAEVGWGLARIQVGEGEASAGCILTRPLGPGGDTMLLLFVSSPTCCAAQTSRGRLKGGGTCG